MNVDLSIDSFYNVFMSTTKVSDFYFLMYKKLLVFHCNVVSIVEDVNPWTNDGGTMWRGYQMLFLWLEWILGIHRLQLKTK